MSSASLGGKTCCLSSKPLGGVALSAELQPGFDGIGMGGEKEGMDGVGRGWRKHIYVRIRGVAKSISKQTVG